MLNRAVDEHFMRNEHSEMWKVVDSPELVLSAIENSVSWDENARSFAAL